MQTITQHQAESPEGPPEGWRDRTTVTVEEYGQILGISRSLAYQSVHRGDIVTLRVGGEGRGGRILIPVVPLRVALGELPSSGVGDTDDPSEGVGERW